MSCDSISTVLCHSVRFESPNEQCGATVEIESHDCRNTRDSTVYILYYPIVVSYFLHSLGNYTRRAIFPEMCKINQSSVVLWVNCLIDGKSILT